MLFHTVGLKLEKLYELAAVHSRCVSSLWILSQCMMDEQGKLERNGEGWDGIDRLSEMSLKALWGALHGKSGENVSARVLKLLNQHSEQGGKPPYSALYVGSEDCSAMLGVRQTLSDLKDVLREVCTEEERTRNDLLLVMQAIQKDAKEWGSLLEEELIRIEVNEGEAHFLLSRQIPLVLHFDSFWRVLNNGAYLTLLDLSWCFLGDDKVLAILGLLANKPQLRVLILDFNEITVRLKSLFVALLDSKNTQRHAVAKFPSLQCLSLTGNPILTQIEDLQTIWKSSLSFSLNSHFPLSKSRGQKRMKTVRVALLEGAGMEAYLIALALRGFVSNGGSGSYEAIWEKIDVFCAVSFSTIVAAAMSLMIPADRIAACFVSIAENVFRVSPLLRPYRMLCARCSGGNYYAVASLASVLRELFGEASDMTLMDIEASTGKHLLFYAALHTNGRVETRGGINNSSSGGQNNGRRANAGTNLFTQSCLAMRSWSRPAPGSWTDEAWLHGTLLEVILACCCAPGMVGPMRMYQGVTLSDAFVVPVPQLVCECLEIATVTCRVHIEFWLPREEVNNDGIPFPMSLLRNPLLLRELAASTDDVVPSAFLLRLRRKQGFEWVADLLGRGFIISLGNGNRLSCSLITLLKPTRRDEIRYDESDVSLLMGELPEAVSTHALRVASAAESTGEFSALDTAPM